MSARSRRRRGHAGHWQAGAAALLVLALGGCATGPSPQVSGRAEDDKAHGGGHDKVDEEVNIDPGVRADFAAAVRYLEAGEYTKGIALLQQVVARSPEHAAPHINLAIAREKLGDLPAAEEHVKKALALDAEHPVANSEYALILRKTGRFAEARRRYERALRAHPELLRARRNLGILCDLYLRDLECALKHYRIYGAAVPDDETVQLWIADLEQRLAQERQ